MALAKARKNSISFTYILLSQAAEKEVVKTRYGYTTTIHV